MTQACQTDKLMSTCVHYGFEAAGKIGRKKWSKITLYLTLAFMHNSFSMVYVFFAYIEEVYVSMFRGKIINLISNYH